MVEESDLENKFHRDVDWLYKNIPPDEIYVFAHQSFLAAEYFLWQWSQWVNVIEEAKKDSLTNLWVQNIVGVKLLRDKGKSIDHRD